MAHFRIDWELLGGWEIRRLKDLAEVIMGQSPKGESYNFWKQGNCLVVMRPAALASGFKRVT